MQPLQLFYIGNSLKILINLTTHSDEFYYGEFTHLSDTASASDNEQILLYSTEKEAQSIADDLNKSNPEFDGGKVIVKCVYFS